MQKSSKRSSGSKTSATVVAAIIGGICVVLAACIGAVATFGAGIWELVKPSEYPVVVQPTSPPAYTIPEEEPTQRPLPTDTPIRPTTEPTVAYPTERPTLPPTRILPTSSPDQKLALGEAYYGDGFRVILDEMFLGQESINFYLEVYNDRPDSLVFSTYYSYARLYDNLGNEYSLTTLGANKSRQYDIYSGGYERIGNWGQLNFQGPIVPGASYLVFGYEQLLGLNNLTWVIQVN